MNRMDRMSASASGDRMIAQGGAPTPQKRKRGWWKFNIITLVITFIVMYNLFPHFTQNVVFDGVIRNGWYVVPVLLILLYCYRYFRRNAKDFNDLRFGRHRRPIAVVSTLVILTVFWCAFVYAGTDYLTYRAFASNFSQRNGLIASAPSFVRFTPLTNACNDISNSISTTGEQVQCKYVAPIITERGFGYAAPITPSGTLNTFWQNNPGFMLLDDSFEVDSDPSKRLTRIDDVQKYGPGMEWFDNLDYVLAKTDFFANYDKPHYLALDPAQPKKLTLVVPKIKYAYLWRLPYWGGVVLVHSDGAVENLTAEQAKRDSRLDGKWIYPLQLARYYVELQNYQIGWGLLTPFIYIAGKLQVESLAGDNQFPFLTQGVDGKTYLVTATRGQGSARGLQRMYFADASTGLGSFHQFGNHEVVYGAGASGDRMTNIPGYQWFHPGERGGGNIVATEPVYVVRPNDPTLYWKFTITNIKYSGISATAVANAARPDDIAVFTRRADFEAWLHGKEVSQPAPGTPAASLHDQILGDIDALVKQIQTLRDRAQKLPK